MPQSLIGLKQIKSGEIGSYITGALGVGSTGSTSVTVYKDLFATGLATFSGNTFFKSGATFNQNVSFNSGAKFSGDITGYNNLVVSGKATVSGIGSFKNNVFLEQAATVSGAFTADGASVFNGTTSFQDPSTFDSSVILNSGISVGVATSVFSGDANLLGDNTFGTNAGSPTNNYFVGTNIFTGLSNFTGNLFSAGTNRFSGANIFTSDVNFDYGNVSFSGATQDFFTVTNLSGYTYINRTGEAENFDVNNSLRIKQTALMHVSGSGLFENNLYLSGFNLFNFLNGASQYFNSFSSSEYDSGAYILLDDNAKLSIKTGAFLNISGSVFNQVNSNNYYYSGSRLIFNSGSRVTGVLYFDSGSHIGIGTTTSDYAFEVKGYDINVAGTGYFTDLRISGYEPITEYKFNAKSYSLALNDTYKIITYNTTSGTPIVTSNIRATGTFSEITNADILIGTVSGIPTTTTATILFSAPIPEAERYLLDVTIASPTF